MFELLRNARIRNNYCYYFLDHAKWTEHGGGAREKLKTLYVVRTVFGCVGTRELSRVAPCVIL